MAEKRAKDWRGENKGNGCEFGFPEGHRVWIEVNHPEEKTNSGIVLPNDVRKKEGNASMDAVVLALGYDVWIDRSGDWADVGDKIVIGRYNGTRLQGTPEDRDIRCIADLDVLGRV